MFRLSTIGMGASLAGLVILAFAGHYWMLLVAAACVGIGSSIFNVSAQSTLQVLVPDDFRGRVMGIWGLTHSTFQPLGQMQMGTMAALFSPLRLRGATLKNRLAIPPMCQYSAEEGIAGDWHFVHLGKFAQGGFALVTVEATAVEEPRDPLVAP